MSENAVPLPDFTRWPSFPFEGDLRVKKLLDPVDVEPPRHGEDAGDCVACNSPDEAYIWVSERWRVRSMDRPTGLPVVLILESRSHLDLGDLPNLLAAELGVMTVRLERAVRSLDGVARVHVNRWGDGSAHLHLWFLARPVGRLQLRGTFLSLWDDILPVIPEDEWRGNLALVAAWLAEFGGRPLAEPPHIAWQTPSTIPFGSPPETEPIVGELDEDIAASIEPAGQQSSDDRDSVEASPSAVADDEDSGAYAGPGSAESDIAGSDVAESDKAEDDGAEVDRTEDDGAESDSAESDSADDVSPSSESGGRHRPLIGERTTVAVSRTAESAGPSGTTSDDNAVEANTGDSRTDRVPPASAAADRDEANRQTVDLGENRRDITPVS